MKQYTSLGTTLKLLTMAGVMLGVSACGRISSTTPTIAATQTTIVQPTSTTQPKPTTETIFSDANQMAETAAQMENYCQTANLPLGNALPWYSFKLTGARTNAGYLSVVNAVNSVLVEAGIPITEPIEHLEDITYYQFPVDIGNLQDELGISYSNDSNSITTDITTPAGDIIYPEGSTSLQYGNPIDTFHEFTITGPSISKIETLVTSASGEVSYSFYSPQDGTFNKERFNAGGGGRICALIGYLAAKANVDDKVLLWDKVPEIIDAKVNLYDVNGNADVTIYWNIASETNPGGEYRVTLQTTSPDSRNYASDLRKILGLPPYAGGQ